MAKPAPSYRDQLFDTLANTIENAGKGDASYDNYTKALDIMDVLEALLAYTISTTANSPESIHAACEESYENIKKRAFMMFEKKSK